MNASSLRLPTGLAATALAALCIAAPTAGAAALDPAIYDAGVLPGQVEHGVYTRTITGSAAPTASWMNSRTEYWISADRWREQTTDAKTGELLSGRLHDAGGTTWLQYKPVNGDPKVLHFKGNDSVPGPGYPAAYNRKLAQTGVTQGPDSSPIAVTLQPIGPRTIAGFAGTAYEQLSNGQPGFVSLGKEPSMRDAHAIVVLQDGTYQPLLRETTAPNGKFGTFTQREVLLSRETISSADAGARLTKLGFARTVTKWKAKVKAAKKAAAKKKNHKK